MEIFNQLFSSERSLRQNVLPAAPIAVDTIPILAVGLGGRKRGEPKVGEIKQGRPQFNWWGLVSEIEVHLID